MISMKSLTLLLILLLVTGSWFSTADLHQDGNLARGVKVVSTGEEILDDDVLAFRFGGRKSTANHFKRPKTVETKGTAAGTISTDLEGKGCLKSDNQKSNTGRILLSDYRVEASYYVSYDADYHAAMHHPPKNN